MLIVLPSVAQCIFWRASHQNPKYNWRVETTFFSCVRFVELDDCDLCVGVGTWYIQKALME